APQHSRCIHEILTRLREKAEDGPGDGDRPSSVGPEWADLPSCQPECIHQPVSTPAFVASSTQSNVFRRPPCLVEHSWRKTLCLTTGPSFALGSAGWRAP